MPKNEGEGDAYPFYFCPLLVCIVCCLELERVCVASGCRATGTMVCTQVSDAVREEHRVTQAQLEEYVYTVGEPVPSLARSCLGQ